MDVRAAELAKSGRRARVVPLGGATACGTLGYTVAFSELLVQCEEMGEAPLTVALSGGTGSTAAGLLLGASLWSPQTKIFVVSASWKMEILMTEIQRCASEAAALIGVTAPTLAGLRVDDLHVGPGMPSPQRTGVEQSAASLQPRALPSTPPILARR
jgi:1-aminocyclopropane-1-carboxylate deaminase/D-cysteine desulfhydrase-like pyridoxal-dependent ACC family enzyme